MSAVDLDEQSIRRIATRVLTYFGKRWLRQQAERKPAGITMKRLLNRVERPHPVVEWYRNYQRWLRGGVKRKEEFLGSVLELTTFGQALAIAGGFEGVSRLDKRLRRADQFEAAAFELEVASNYAKVGWEVEFLEEGSERTPDLRLYRAGIDAEAYVECKRRDRMTERDLKIDGVWQGVGGRLMDRMVRGGESTQVELTWMRDPIDTDYELVLETLSRARNRLREAGDRIGFPVVVSIEDVLELIYTRLTDGTEFEADRLQHSTRYAPDRLVMTTQMMRREDGSTLMRQPNVLALRTADPPDRVKGILQSFKAARGQLPKNKPGIVWIRIPDNMWTSERHFERAAELLRPKLQGQINRRVNVVNIMTREFRKLEDGIRTGQAYTPVWISLEHSNPAIPFPRLEGDDRVGKGSADHD